MNKLYAHTPNDEGEWHYLEDHVVEVAELARCFAEKFGAGDLAFWAGLWHDLGKCLPEFQAYLQACAKKQHHSKFPHAIWGGVMAYRIFNNDERWKEIALPLACHHKGLVSPGSLSQGLHEKIPETLLLEHMRKYAQTLPKLPKFKLSLPEAMTEREKRKREMFIRMVYSALVDADYLNTEKHFKYKLYTAREQSAPLDDLLDIFTRNQNELLQSIDGTKAVNQVRFDVYKFCCAAAVGEPGIYRLTVPTGGGKTRSSLAFALKHSVEKKMDRIIMAIPYTSIIDQTAKEYRKILGHDNVLEHHSQVSLPPDNGENQDVGQIFHRLASENWAAPLIVTTTVQLFESLFSNQPSKTRKLHNLANSVIVLDEVQALPPELLKPTLDALRDLTENYRTTVVLCTATQPVFEDSHYLDEFKGMQITDIIPPPTIKKHFDSLDRVCYKIRKEPVLWSELADEIKEMPQLMVVLNSRKDALTLVNELKGVEHVFHLSTLLCGANRRLILHKIRKRLKAKAPVRLISTQVVEAGVDIDFPVVYRAIGPLDRIIQVAGRCNREGLLGNKGGRTVIFEPAEGKAPDGPYKIGLWKARLLLQENGVERMNDTEFHREYFRLLFNDPLTHTDKHEIQSYREAMDYEEVARKYKMIPDDTVPVVVPYCKGMKGRAAWMKRLDAWLVKPNRRTWQRLQPFIVNIYRYELQNLGGDIEEVSTGLYKWRSFYDDNFGMVSVLADPSDLVR